MKKIKQKNHILVFLFGICMLLSTPALFAQISISGTITDNLGEPLTGVNVSIKGTMIGNITDIDGKYTLQAPNERSVIVFSYIGYRVVEVVVGSQRVINQQLSEDTQSLDEVVVVGYGVQRKVTVTGSVATVAGEKLQASPTTNITNAMVGRMPGVIGFQTSDEPGGGGTTIRIRGTNSLGSSEPLIVIDGIPDRDGGINRLNPTEIEQISVLKDASAAIYGSRAANGVILVTTKRGKEGRATITFNASGGFSSPTRLPKMANAFEYATMVNEINPGTWSAEDLQLFKDGTDPWGHPDTDWFDVAIKEASPVYRTNLGISGGTEKVKYFVNFGANGEDGIYRNSANRYDQYSFRVNLDFNISKYVDFQFGNVSRLEDTQYPIKSAGSIFSGIRRGKPTQNAYWPTGEPGPDLERGDNPAVTSTDAAGFDRQKAYFIQNNVSMNVKIPWIEGLSLQANASYDKRFKNRKKFEKPIFLYSWDGINRNSSGLSGANRYIAAPQLTREHEDQTEWMLNGLINYNRKFNNHDIGVTVGMEAQKKVFDRLDGFRNNYVSDIKPELDLGGPAGMTNRGYSWEEARLNYFGRVSYNYLERYLFEFVWRVDGSYRFPEDKRFGFFPGISAAWRASEEEFWKNNVTFIDYFKLRASISQTGSDNLLDTDRNYDRSIQYLNTFGYRTQGIAFGGLENQRLYPIRMPNPGITWEVGTTYDLGFDLKFLDNRLGLESDLFYMKRTNMLISRNASLPEISGITLPRENIGEMENKGFEMLLSWDDKVGDLQYHLSLNATYAKNKILFWDETPGVPEYQKSTGKPAGRLNADGDNLFYIADGIFHNQAEIDAYPHWNGTVPGDIRFVDYNGDKVINADDRVRSDKNEEPPFVFGFTIGLNWKNWDLMALFQGATGAEVYIKTWSGTIGNFLKDYYDKRWTPENPNANGPRTFERENQYWANPGNRNTYFVYDTDYVRLKNLELGYKFTSSALQKAGISNLRLYTNGTNLFMLDKLKIADPESRSRDVEAYPQRRIINFGIQATF
ncbi:MAG: TonB-dependent receptor [Tannerellaceae bacterium]|jgi:TonB-linked SusC/RagA family outer membrane protein|nr:TonB-dependent receptor [Tannerellaceae bacterium]